MAESSSRGGGRPGSGKPGSRGGGSSGRGGSGGSGRGRSVGGPGGRRSSDSQGEGRGRSADSRGDSRGRPERQGRDDRQRQDRGPRQDSRSNRAPRDDTPRSDDQRRYDGPDIPEHITGKELDRSVMAQLKSLPEKLALRVARHLVAANEALESNPKLAYEHTLAARARAGRLSVVREAVGEAAYAAGEYAEALAELRSARRMNGSVAYFAIMADCERALGRADKALALIRSAPRERLTAEEQVELTIVEAGARRDRREFDAALRTLEAAPLGSKSRAPWLARLRYVYADTLSDAGQLAEALEWFHRAEAVDVDAITDAGDRAAEVEKRLRAR